ncbi:MAG TPA: hypothetical protein VHD57_14840 [Vicinamibacterales bacterium]|nr:hypothetical protein [Vicinamibacterales bacterium]
MADPHPHPPPSADTPALSYLEVLDDEYWALKGETAPESCRRLRAAFVAASCGGDAAATDRAERAFRHDVIGRLHAAKRSAICFSGGGIRSATFGLGILQGLAAYAQPGAERPALIGEFDFLSTVSGGGYLGAWFSAWATRAARPDATTFRTAAADAVDGPGRVMTALASAPDTAFEPEPAAVQYLRSYSNYLTPRLGLSGDTLALAATVLRNMFLNWLVLLPVIAATLLVPLGARAALASPPAGAVGTAFLVLGALSGGLATAYIGFDLPSAGNARGSTARYVAFGLLPLIVAAVLLNTYWGWRTLTDGVPALTIGQFVVFGAAMHGGGMLAGIFASMVHFRRPAPATGLYATAAAGVTGAIAGALGFEIARAIGPLSAGNPAANATWYTCIAFPLLMSVFLVAGTLLVGLSSYITEDKDREWWARAGGWLLAVTIGWPIFAALTLYARDILHAITVAGASVLAAATGWGAARLGSRPSSPAAPYAAGGTSSTGSAPLGLTDIAARLVLPVFLVLLVLLLADVDTYLLAWARGWFEAGGLVSRSMPWVAYPAAVAPIVGLVLVAIGVGASFWINVNSFSLHSMYRQRLIRAYLGASNERRQPHPFTGFDERDNMPMCALTVHRPLHVVNITLNLVGGAKLAWQQRKAEPFTATRLHTGSCRVGYRPSTLYGGKYRDDARKTAITLGTAMTISGAAASPNMGYNSSPLVTIVMALFNARLGWWLGNPRRDGAAWRLPGPRFGIRTFIDEMFGMTDDRNTWVYLSDGGHFENLGLYEMVLRRSAVIVLSDAGADPAYGYEDVGNAVRKIRIDLGIPIDFDTPMPRRLPPDGAAAAGPEPRHAALARIRYSAVDPGAEDGVLIYLKPSLTGDEPADVLHYASERPTFPHETTTDQFFSEAQFESYRRLGLHVIEEICGASADPLGGRSTIDLDGLVGRARAYCRG